jgi:hypothetical protein
MTDLTTTLDAVATPSVPPESPFRWRLAHRPDVRFGHAAGGVAGILVAAAFFAFVVAVAGDDNPTWPGVGFHAGLIVIALLAGWKVRGPVRSAAVAALALAIPLLWVFAVFADERSDGRWDFRIYLLLTVVSYVTLYLLTWTRGRAVLLGLALLFAANWVVFEVASQEVPFAVDVAGQAQSGGLDDSDVVTGGDKTTETGLAELGVAIVLLGAGVALDRRRKPGAATPCLLIGGIYGVYAAIVLGADVENVYALGAFVLLAGLAIGLAGTLGRRRGTSWIGALVALGGAVTMVVQGTTETASGGGDDTAWSFAGYALLAAAVLLVVGVLVARGFDEPVDGGEPGPVAAPPAAPAPEPEPALVGAATAGTEAAATDATPDAPPASDAPPAADEAPAPPVAWSAEPPATPPSAEPEPDAPEGGSAEPPSESNDGV